MSGVRSIWMAVGLLVAGVWLGAGLAQAQEYDPQAPCGRDENGFAYPCRVPDPSANLEAACLTTGRVQNCFDYHRNNCQRGFALACRLASLGSNCFGGDPNTCNYYISLLRANTACNLDHDQQACAWLQQQQY